MLTDNIMCINCCNEGPNCTCVLGPSWSKERAVFNDLVAWVERTPHLLSCSQSSYHPNPDRKCGCGKDELLQRARGLKWNRS